MFTGIIIPLSVFVWLYLDAKNKRQAMIEMSKNIDDPEKIEALLQKLDGNNKKEPIDYRRGGTITFLSELVCISLGITALGLF